MGSFVTAHPAVALVYFLSVLGVAMFVPHPLLLFLALWGAFLYATAIRGLPHPVKTLLLYGLLFLATGLSNPLFSHHGATPLFFLNGNPITLEALLYGGNLGLLFAAVLAWFTCLNLVLTQDKLLYLFGRVSPKFGALLSGALRWLPRLRHQAQEIRRAQRTMGLYASDAWTDRLRGTLRVYSALTTWGLENALHAGASMQARGYGLPGRKAYSPFYFRRADAMLLTCILSLDALLLPALVAGRFDFTFYPAVHVPPTDLWSILGFAAFALLTFLPWILELKEATLWKYYNSKI